MCPTRKDRLRTVMVGFSVSSPSSPTPPPVPTARCRWLYPFLDTSKPWAPLAYLGLYVVHWMAFGIVALLYRVKAAVYSRMAAAVTAGGKIKTQ